jgi:integrase
MIYRRGDSRIWWYEFVYEGHRIRESTGVTNQAAARDAEVKRKNELRLTGAGISKRRTRVPIFNAAAEAYLGGKRPDWAAKTAIIEKTNLAHLQPIFGKRLLNDIDAADVAAYRVQRLDAGASPKTVSLELGTLRAILRFHDLDATWIAIAKKVKLAKAEKVGRKIPTEEQAQLLEECRQSRSRSLYPAVIVALEACLRYSELRLMRWSQVDFQQRTITVGASKTDAGENRVVPMSSVLYHTLTMWADQFPLRKATHFVFPRERYGHKGVVYNMDATKPIGTWKYAWKDARKRAGVSARFHDLRHTGCTRLLDSGVSHPIVAEIMGWSASTAIRMIKEVYGHIGLDAKMRAMQQAENFPGPARSPQKSPQLDVAGRVVIQ